MKPIPADGVTRAVARRAWTSGAWIGTVACIVLVVMIALSFRWSFHWEGRQGTLAVRHGTLYYWTQAAGAPGGISIRPAWEYRGWWFDTMWVTLRTGHGWVPLWVPLLMGALLSGWSWWRAWHRFPRGCCSQCGYDLTGNASGRCPECGHRLVSPAARRP